MSEYWTVGDIADYCDVVNSTIHKRAERHAWALSDSATPKKGEERRYSPRDVAILLEIDRRLKMGDTHEKIEQDLQHDVKRGEFDDIDEFPTQEEPEGLMPIAEHNRMMARAEELVRDTTERAKKAEKDLLEAREKIAYLEGQIEELRRQGNPNEIVRLNREIARLELRLELEKEKHLETADGDKA